MPLGDLSDEEAVRIRKAVQDYFSGARPRIEMGMASGWISVEDDLPDDDEDVWVYDQEKGVIVGFCYRFDWYNVYGDEGIRDDGLFRVTHWMPIDRPEPPGQEGEG